MIARVEAVQNWLENVTYQMCNMNYAQQSEHLAGQIGFLKMYATRTGQDTAVDATQIFGGRAISSYPSLSRRSVILTWHGNTHQLRLVWASTSSIITAPSLLTLSSVEVRPCYGPCLDLVLISILSAEDVLGDLGVRQAMKKIPKNTRL